MRARVPLAVLVPAVVAGGLGGSTAVVHATAMRQAAAIAYAHAETWASQPPPLFAPLDWPAGHVAGGVGFDAAGGRVLVTDLTDHAVRVYAADGAFVTAVGRRGFGPGQLNAPRDADALPGGDLVVSDTDNHRVQVLRADGSPVASWPVNVPQGIAVVRDWIYVVSRGDRKVYAFTSTGVLQRTLDLASRATAPEGLAYRGDVAGAATPPYAALAVSDPVAGAVLGARDGSNQVVPLLGGVAGVRAAAPWSDPAAQLWLAAAGAGVAVIRASGEVIATLPFDGASDVAVAPDGRVFAAVGAAGAIVVPDLPYVIGKDADTFGRLLGPRRIAAGDAVAIADGAPRLQLWSRAGRPERDVRFVLAGAGTWRGAAGGSRARVAQASAGPRVIAAPLPEADLAAPADVAAAGDGVFALWRGGRIRRWDGRAFGAEWAPAAGEARWLVALSAHGDRVAAFDAVQQAVVLWDRDLRPAGGFRLSGGDASGVADLALTADRVFVIDPRTYRLSVWGLDGTRIAARDLAGRPERVAADPAGRAFVLTRAGWVLAFDPAGEPSGAWPVAAGDERPVDLAVGADGRLYVADAGGMVRVYVPDGEAVAGLPQLGGSGACGAIAHKSAQPGVVEIGQTVEVQLVVDGSCPPDDQTVDVVLTIDRSGSMDGRKLLAAKDAAIGFVNRVRAPRSRVGVTTFSTGAERVQPLAEDRAPAVAAIAGLAAGGSTNLVDGLDEARRTMVAAPWRAEAKRVIVFMSDGRHSISSPSLDDLAKVITAVRGDHIEVFTIGLGADVDRASMRRMATDDSHYYDSPSEDELAGIYEGIAGRIGSAPLFRDVTVVDVVPGNMTFLPGTGRPVEPAWDPAARTLTWALGEVVEPGFRLSYRLRPEAGGVWPTNVEARTRHTDGRGQPGQLVFPVPFVRVLAPDPTPTPTAPPTDTPTPTPTPRPSATPTPTPTLTPTATPTDTPTPTPTDTPTPTPTPRPRPIYLPLALVDRCSPQTRQADIVLVLDTSSSMAAATHAGGPPKLAAAAAAAREFVGLLHAPNETVAVVQFNDAAALLQDLTADAAAARHALDRLTMGQGTRIDAGIGVAQAILTGPRRRPDAHPVVVLLTDGRPTRSSLSDVILAGERLKRAGASVFTVGLGPDVDPALLQVIATNPGFYFFAPGTGELSAVYRTIAKKIPCPRTWP